MVFSSNIFVLYFLPIFLLVYHLAGKKYRNYVLLAASIFFYSWGAPKFVFVILASTILDFYLVNQIYVSLTEKRRKLFLTLSVIINLGLLVYFKYVNFFVENLNVFFEGVGIKQVSWTSVALPIGISFYTFQTITYAVDVYRKTQAPLKKVTDYLLYIMSFPQMIAGPIVRYSAVADQITNRTEVIDDKLIGFYRFCLGLGKKVLIANILGEQADLIFDADLTQISTTEAWIGMMAFTFQIYFDFSGYSDMAIGLGRIMGFHFPENFNYPYLSQSISEFWRRWHITLGSFMRDYLYIPLGGNRVSTKLRLYSNLWIVFLLSGLWHGSSWNFVLWGAYHGMFLVLDRLFLSNVLVRIGRVPATIITLFIVMLGWLFFRLERFNEVINYMAKLFSFEKMFQLDAIPAFGLVILLAIIFSFCGAFNWVQLIEKKLFQLNQYSIVNHLTFLVISLIILLFSVSLITASGFNPFIYYRF